MTKNVIRKKDIASELHSTWRENGFVTQEEQTEQIIDSIFNLVIEKILQGFEFKVKRFGVLKMITRKPRAGRHMVTGEKIIIPEKKTIAFKINYHLRKEMNE